MATAFRLSLPRRSLLSSPTTGAMTLVVPLDANASTPQGPAFLSPVAEPATYASKVVKAILKAKRIAVVCGAGISVQAGIPDFRSAEGLFQSIKRENPREALNSGKDLFDAAVFNSENTTTLFCQMISRLASLSDNAEPTPFHALLRTLDERGNLLRVYTQNIDALEVKAGLTLGLPENDDRRTKGKGRAKPKANATIGGCDAEDETPGASSSKSSSPVPTAEDGASAPTPRCIPLHGTLQTMHCTACTQRFPLSGFLASLSAGALPDCPDCAQLEATRSLVGKRPRGIGKLRPSVVLYNEDHKDGEVVGGLVERDLLGLGAKAKPKPRPTAEGEAPAEDKGKGRERGGAVDLLLVVGTSLRVKGTKTMVREFSKAVRARASARTAQPTSGASSGRLPTPRSSPTTSPTPTPSPRRSPAGEVDEKSLSDEKDRDRPIRSVYLNLDFPVPSRDWDGVFDVWVQGDAQAFAALVQTEMAEAERAEAARVARKAERERVKEERERVKEELEREALEAERKAAGKKKAGKGKGKKRKAEEEGAASPKNAKRPRIMLHVRSPTTPSRSATSSPTTPRTPAKRKKSAASPLSPSTRVGASVKGKSKAPPSSSAKQRSRAKRSPVVETIHTHRSPLPPSPSSQSLRWIPEVVITDPPPSASHSDAHQRTGQFSTTGLATPRPTPKPGTVTLGAALEPASPLDMLATAAVSASRAEPLPVFNHQSTRFPAVVRQSYTDALPLARWGSYPYSNEGDRGCNPTCTCCSPLSPLLTPAPSPMLVPAVFPTSGSARPSFSQPSGSASAADVTKNSALSAAPLLVGEAHVPGPPTPATSQQRKMAPLRPDIRNLLNKPGPSVSARLVRPIVIPEPSVGTPSASTSSTATTAGPATPTKRRRGARTNFTQIKSSRARKKRAMADGHREVPLQQSTALLAMA